MAAFPGGALVVALRLRGPCRRLFQAARRPLAGLDFYLGWQRSSGFAGHDETPAGRLATAFADGRNFWRLAFDLRNLPPLHRAENSRRVNPELFLQLNRVIHEKRRLAIMSALAAAPELAFTELRDLLDMTDGNLTTHIRTLQQEGFVSVAKSYQNNRPLTSCALTAAGRKAFAQYIDLLDRIVRQSKAK